MSDNSDYIYWILIITQASDNNIESMQSLEKELGGITTLSTIYLERNPCQKADMTGYRRKIMLALPQIKQIDATFTRGTVS